MDAIFLFSILYICYCKIFVIYDVIFNFSFLSLFCFCFTLYQYRADATQLTRALSIKIKLITSSLEICHNNKNSTIFNYYIQLS